MSKDVPIWLALGALILAGVMVSRYLDTSLSEDEYKAIVEQQFRLPDDVAYASFLKSDVARRGTGIEAIVQFTPAQFEAYSATLNDPNVWRHVPFVYKGVATDSEAQPGALQWLEHSGAFITKDQSAALFWLNWGRSHSKPDDGGTPINGARAWRSFCFAVMPKDMGSRVVACNDLPANNTPQTLFAPGERPVFFVRGLLDRDTRRLYMHIR